MGCISTISAMASAKQIPTCFRLWYITASASKYRQRRRQRSNPGAGFVWSATTGKLYLWAVAGGAIPGMKDYALKKNRRK